MQAMSSSSDKHGGVVRHYEQNEQLVIRVEGRFDYQTHEAFRNAYLEASDASRTWVVDLTRAQFLDSAALGMLLLSREKAETQEASVEIICQDGHVAKVLDVAGFDRHFKIIRKR